MLRPSVLLLLLAVALGACAGSPPDVPVGPDGQVNAELVLGRNVYSRNCANCHGSAGDGGTGPKLSDGAVVEAYPDVTDQAAVISDGRNAMPSFSDRLSDDELKAVVRYTREVLSLP